MKIMDFFLKMNFDFTPKTPFAAIEAYELGILPIEFFIYKSTSTMALDEENLDLNEIERILAKQNLDIFTNCLLINILEKLINNSNPEIALFAAESINLIESRYNKKIELSKKNIETIEERIKLASLYYELALINYKKASIRNFYFKESYFKIKDIITMDKIKINELSMLIKIFIELKQYDNAINLLDQLNKDDNVILLSLIAEVEFERKNYTTVYNMISKIFAKKKELNANLGIICSYWLDSPWIERSEFVS